jgi:hypothetical protein
MGEGRQRHCTVKPPSTGSVWPVTNDAASDASHSTAAATSSGLPMRPMGCRPSNCFRMSSEVTKRLNMSVSMPAGATALTRMFLRAYSSATDLVSPDDRVLARAVNRHTGGADHARDAGIVDDGAAALPQHLTDFVDHRQPQALDVDAKDLVEIRLRFFMKRAECLIDSGLKGNLHCLSNSWWEGARLR